MSETHYERTIDRHTFSRSRVVGIRAVLRCSVRDKFDCEDGSYMTMDGVVWFTDEGAPVSAELSADLTARAHGYVCLLLAEEGRAVGFDE